MQGMNKPATPKPAHACEFDELRAKMRRCVRRSRRPSRMVGIEVAYVALADWLAAVAQAERRTA